MSDQKGLYQKYTVTRTDGEDITGQDFFLLRLDAKSVHGYASRKAAEHYAELILNHDPRLAMDLTKRIDDHRKNLECEQRPPANT